MNTYMQKGLMARDPFMTLDREGVGEIIRIACERGRATRPTLRWVSAANTAANRNRSGSSRKPVSILYPAHPYRVPIARLAAAQAAIASRDMASYESFRNWSATASQASPRRNRCAVSGFSDCASMVTPSALSDTRMIWLLPSVKRTKAARWNGSESTGQEC